MSWRSSLSPNKTYIPMQLAHTARADQEEQPNCEVRSISARIRGVTPSMQEWGIHIFLDECYVDCVGSFCVQG